MQKLNENVTENEEGLVGKGVKFQRIRRITGVTR